VKDFARVAQLSAEEAFRLLQGQYRQDGEALWARFECELARRLGDAEQQHGSRVQELEALIKVSKERSILDNQRIRTELEAKLRSEHLDKEDFRRKIEEYLLELSRVRSRNQELEAEMSKVVRRGKLEEVSFEDEVQSWPGICLSEKLPKNSDFILAYRDPSGAALEPQMLVDCKDKLAISEVDISKLVRDAKERLIPVAFLVARDETLRQVDKQTRWDRKDGVWLLRTTRQWLPRDLDVLKPLFEQMRVQGLDFLDKNAALAEEVRRTFVDLDRIEGELKKATKAITSASGLVTKYRGKLQELCDNAPAQKMPLTGTAITATLSA
jgi:predicted nuclease with TOPRIM domain